MNITLIIGIIFLSLVVGFAVGFAIENHHWTRKLCLGSFQVDKNHDKEDLYRLLFNMNPKDINFDHLNYILLKVENADLEGAMGVGTSQQEVTVKE